MIVLLSNRYRACRNVTSPNSLRTVLSVPFREQTTTDLRTLRVSAGAGGRRPLGRRLASTPTALRPPLSYLTETVRPDDTACNPGREVSRYTLGERIEVA